MGGKMAKVVEVCRVAISGHDEYSRIFQIFFYFLILVSIFTAEVLIIFYEDGLKINF